MLIRSDSFITFIANIFGSERSFSVNEIFGHFYVRMYMYVRMEMLWKGLDILFCICHSCAGYVLLVLHCIDASICPLKMSVGNVGEVR